MLAQWTGPLLLILLAVLVLWRRAAAVGYRRARRARRAGPDQGDVAASRARGATAAGVRGRGRSTRTSSSECSVGRGGIRRAATPRSAAARLRTSGCGRSTSSRATTRSPGPTTSPESGTTTSWWSSLRPIRRSPRFSRTNVCTRCSSSGLMDEDHLEDFVPNLRGAARSASRTRSGWQVHEVPPRPLRGEEVALRDYDQFVRLPDRLDRKDVRIVQFDLYDLADPDHVVESIETSVVPGLTVQFIDTRLRHMVAAAPVLRPRGPFDVGELALEGERLAYLVLASTLEEGRAPDEPGLGGSDRSDRGRRRLVDAARPRRDATLAPPRRKRSPYVPLSAGDVTACP